MILVVGNLRVREAGPSDGAVLDGFRFVGFRDLTAALLAEVRPAMVLSALMGNGFDALDVARSLAFLGFRGPYRALSPPLPDPDTVRREIAGAAPSLDFDLLIVGDRLH